MENVRRIYVEKKTGYAVKAQELKEDLIGYLNMSGIEDVRMFIRYDVENQFLILHFSHPQNRTPQVYHLVDRRRNLRHLLSFREEQHFLHPQLFLQLLLLLRN